MATDFREWTGSQLPLAWILVTKFPVAHVFVELRMILFFDSGAFSNSVWCVLEVLWKCVNRLISSEPKAQFWFHTGVSDSAEWWQQLTCLNYVWGVLTAGQQQSGERGGGGAALISRKYPCFAKVPGSRSQARMSRGKAIGSAFFGPVSQKASGGTFLWAG